VGWEREGAQIGERGEKAWSGWPNGKSLVTAALFRLLLWPSFVMTAKESSFGFCFGFQPLRSPGQGQLKRNNWVTAGAFMLSWRPAPLWGYFGYFSGGTPEGKV
jgi:hypothetical protein